VIAPADRRLGKYEILRKLGRGGMADVYLAQDTELGAPVALKLIEHSPDTDTQDFIEAERRGAGLQAHLAAVDPRVARVYDAGDVDGYFFIAMEYVDGEDLSDVMRRGPMGVEAAARVAVEVARTLDSAHNLQAAIDGKDFRGIVHGDIKPKNIRIDTGNRVRVLDFGIAKALSLSRRLTRNEFGSVPYASPERLDTGSVDVHSDLWALAVMLYEMATGLKPYQADNTERLERMIRSRIAPPPAPDPCPEPLRRILIKAMAPAPDSRYASASDFAGDLESFQRGEPVRAMTEDLDATRRTVRRTEDKDATRRTAPHGDGPSEETRVTAPASGTPATPVEWASQRPHKLPRSLFKRSLQVAGALALAGILYFAWSTFSAYHLRGKGQDLERRIQTEELTDPNKIWAEWTELSNGHSSSWLLKGPRDLIEQKFVESAERVIAAYRDDAQQVYENDWRRARTLLSRALELDPSDKIRGELRLSEAHLARISGTARDNASQLQSAVENFNAAQKLLPKSPDPQLGLARVYVYGLKDIDKAYDALREAERRGHKLSNRDKAQLADGYRDRADRTWRDAQNIRGLPQEKEQMERVANDYKMALDLYQSVAPYGNASVQIARVQKDLESVNARTQQLSQGESAGWF
jgi:eukaryotic-like serine/threonine-protein kinase